MKLGKIVIDLGYAVDLDDAEMVRHAKESLFEDIMNAVKYNELGDWINIIETPEANEEDIPEFLQEVICPNCKEKVYRYELNDKGDKCDNCGE